MNKYHIQDEPLNPFTRMVYHGVGYMEESGLDENGLFEGLKRPTK